jgi:hypothetical protein
MAFRHFLKSVKCKLFGFDVLGLSPSDEHLEELLALSLKLEDLGKQVVLPLQCQEGLRAEVKGSEDRFLDLLMVIWAHTLSVIKEIFLHENGSNLTDTFILIAQIGNKKLKKGSWVRLALIVDLTLGSLPDYVVGIKYLCE